MKYVFHYDQSRKADETRFFEDEFSYRESLLSCDGKTCKLLEEVDKKGCVDVVFEDGNELQVYFDELTECDEKERYEIDYRSGATGYGWSKETDDLLEVLRTIEALYHYTTYISVWDNVKRDFVFRKRVLKYNPDINTIDAECHAR